MVNLRNRVSAQLLDAASGAHLWAEPYDPPLTATNIIGVQDEITQRVVAKIGDAYGIISRARFKESKGKKTDSLDAHECLLHACEERDQCVTRQTGSHMRAERGTGELDTTFAIHS